jgi:hypothetical protein
VADQLVRRVFSKKSSDYKLEAASIVTGGVTYLLLSRHLPNSFKVGAPILYLAYKAAQYYLSRQTPADSSAKIVRYSPYLPSHVDLFILEPHLPPPPAATKPVEKTGPASEPPVSPPPVVVPTGAPAKSEDPLPATLPVVVSTDTPLPAPPPAALTAEEKAARKEAADRMNAVVEAERLAIKRFRNIIAPFEKSQIMSLKIQIRPLPNAAAVAGKKPLKAETVKVQIRFGSTHVFKLGKTQVKALNKEGCAVTEKTLFFWIDIVGQEKRGITCNFIPLMMLDSLKPDAREFSLILDEKDHQLILPFKEEQLARLKTVAQTLQACRKVEVIRSGIVQPFENTAASDDDLLGALISNDMASINQARCYIGPFMK